MPRYPRREPSYRLRLDLPASTRDLVGELRSKLGATSFAEVIRRAIVVFAVISRATEEGTEVYFRPKGTEGLNRVYFL